MTLGKTDARFIPIAPGDTVRPKPGYESLGVPSGKVLSVACFGKHGAIYVEGERRAFVGQCFEVVERCDRGVYEGAG